MECSGCLWIGWGYLQVTHHERLMARLLDGVCSAVSRIYIPLMLSKSPINTLPDSFLPPFMQLII